MDLLFEILSAVNFYDHTACFTMHRPEFIDSKLMVKKDFLHIFKAPKHILKLSHFIYLVLNK